MNSDHRTGFTYELQCLMLWFAAMLAVLGAIGKGGMLWTGLALGAGGLWVLHLFFGHAWLLYRRLWVERRRVDKRQLMRWIMGREFPARVCGDRVVVSITQDELGEFLDGGG